MMMSNDKEIRELVAQARNLGAIIRTKSEGGDGKGGGDTVVEVMVRSGISGVGQAWMPVIQAAEVLRSFIAIELDEPSPPALKCPRCGKSGSIVNECGCDPNNIPTIPDGYYLTEDLDGERFVKKTSEQTPQHLGQHKKPLWQVATSTINNPDCDDATKMIALWIRRILAVESELEERTETLYVVKEQRDRFLGFCRVVLPESPERSALWDHEIGKMFVELNRKDREKYRELLDKASSYCPPVVQDEIRALLKKSD